jgi:spermidine synthase
VTRPVVVERVTTSHGELVLRRDGEDYEVIANGVFLMDTRDGRSERLLVTAALDRHTQPRHVLVAGLGVGFSLAVAVADPRVEQVTVVEREPSVVRWHASHLAARSGGSLDDARVTLFEGDVARLLRDSRECHDVICLDVDNGPQWTVSPDNAALYDDDGTALLVSRLRPGGILSVWSAAPAPAYLSVLERHLTGVEALGVAVPRGEPDVVMLGRRHPR